MALLGAITHQTLAVWAPAHGRRHSFYDRFRAVPSASFANAIVVLYAVSTLLGGTVYLYFRVDIRPELERAGHWPALGLFDLKEHFISIGLALLPAYVVVLKLDLALFTVYPSFGVVFLGTHHSRDVAPSLGFLAPAMYWYAGPPQPRSERST